MPPVLGPVSPSPSRLWSWAAGSRRSCAPSVRANTDSSSPFKKSSMTISRPASPNAASASIARAARTASVRRAQGVREPGGERPFRAHDGEIDLVLAGRGDEFGGGAGGKREVGAELGGAGVAGSREDSRVGEVALQRPAECVLAAASPDDQDFHVFLLNASVNAWAARLAVSTTSFTTAFASFM